MKDGINDSLVGGCPDAVSPERTGTRAAAHRTLAVGARGCATLRLRLRQAARREEAAFGAAFDELLEARRDEAEFPSSHGIRALSHYHAAQPHDFRVPYLPAASDSGMFGGNSNWRGPVWMPDNAMIIRALLQYHYYYGNAFKVECPTGSGRQMNHYEVAQEITGRLRTIFLRDEHGRRPVHGGVRKFQEDPRWRDRILFYEYYHGDIGASLGASHQTGWSGVIARAMHIFATTSADQVLDLGKAASVAQRVARNLRAEGSA